jgi:hypothetical protein
MQSRRTARISIPSQSLADNAIIEFQEQSTKCQRRNSNMQITTKLNPINAFLQYWNQAKCLGLCGGNTNLMENPNWGYIQLGLVKGAVPPLGNQRQLCRICTMGKIQSYRAE